MSSKKLHTILLILLSILNFNVEVYSQHVIKLQNNSFEGEPKSEGVLPRSWFNCGFSGESAPDTQPGAYSVSKPAIHGSTYLGMVIRDIETYERVGQKLSSALQGGKCYSFSIYLARSEEYLSQSENNSNLINFNTPARFLVYGGNKFCERTQVLAETEAIEHTKWKKYEFVLEPETDLTHIVFEANYVTPNLFPYNGNVLVDKASDIQMISCENGMIIKDEEIKKEVKEETKVDPPKVVEMNSGPNGLNLNTLKVGSIIKMEEIHYAANSTKIDDKSIPALEELYKFLKQEERLIIEVGGHTNSFPPSDVCDRLSTARAKSVAQYLYDRGISRKQVYYRGYGKRRPIATNKTEEGRQKNQRVEIKILRAG